MHEAALLRSILLFINFFNFFYPRGLSLGVSLLHVKHKF